MSLASLKAWTTHLLRTRVGTESEDRHGEGEKLTSNLEGVSPPRINPEERRLLLQLARESLTKAALRACPPSLGPPVGVLNQSGACFITLTKRGTLRGCVGQVFPKETLVQAVIHNARAAALEDPRFPAVTLDEVDSLSIEISVLSEVRPLTYSSPEDLLSQLHPTQDGVLLQVGFRQATFLPQVWDKIPGKEDFLNRLCEKAGCPPGEWRSGYVTIYVYQVESFALNSPPD